MLTKLSNTKILVTELTNPEKMNLRRKAVNYSVKDGVFVLEDNIFNRLLLGIEIESKLTKNPHVYCSDEVSERDINPVARTYQRKDIGQMIVNNATLNVNKPGYGKTFEAIEYCRILGLERILVICPKSVCSQWKDQFAKWWPEVATKVVVGGDGPKRGVTSVFVTNYEQFTPVNISKDKKKKQLMYPQVWRRCKEWVWDCIILDESHKIKNPSAQITIALEQLPAMYKLCLTGTPILGRPDDLWSQLHFLDPWLSGNNFWCFKQRFCEMARNAFGEKPVGLTPSKELQDLLRSALEHITVGGENHKVTEGKNMIDIELPMPAEMRNLYKAVLDLAFEQLDELGVTVKNAMDQTVKLQQCTTNPGKLKAGLVGPKFEWIKDWLEDNEGEKVVIFTKFAETAKALQKYLGRDGVLYIGEMSEKERTASKEIFVATSARSPRALIGTIGALGVGVDGLQHVCRNVVFLDRDWTPALNQQAEDRVNRSGQVGMTNVWCLSMKNSIDKYVEKIQGKKDKDIEEVFKYVRDSFGSGE